MDSRMDPAAERTRVIEEYEVWLKSQPDLVAKAKRELKGKVRCRGQAKKTKECGGLMERWNVGGSWWIEDVVLGFRSSFSTGEGGGGETASPSHARTHRSAFATYFLNE
jgi:hypothetical protein